MVLPLAAESGQLALPERKGPPLLAPRKPGWPPTSASTRLTFTDTPHAYIQKSKKTGVQGAIDARREAGHPTPMTNLGSLCLELLSGKGLESAFLEEIGLKHETVLCHHGAVFPRLNEDKDGPMAAQTSASSSRASAKWAQRRAKRSESLSGSMRQFLTPEVWKQVKQVASQHGCRNGVRWTLQPLIMIAAIMTWCAGETDADRFVLSAPSTSRFIAPSDSDLARRLAAFARHAAFAHARLVGILCRAVARLSPLGRPHDHGRLVAVGV